MKRKEAPSHGGASEDRLTMAKLQASEDRWLSVDEIAAHLGIKRETYTVDRNCRGSRIDPISKGSFFPVDHHPSPFDQDVGLPTRRDARPCDQFVESFDDDSGRIGISRVSTISAGGT